jgi:hypothetical protein
MKKYSVVIIVVDEEDQISKDDILEMVKENMLQYIDCAPITVDSLQIEEL